MEKFEKSEKKRILIGDEQLKELLNSQSDPRFFNRAEDFLTDASDPEDWNKLSAVVLTDNDYSVLAPWKQFKKIVCRYVNHPEDICLGYDRCTKLKGFNLDADDLLSLIDPQTYPPISGTTTTAPKVDRIIALFGIRGGKLTMVFGRVDGNGDLLYDWAIEYVDPCPDNCPNQLACDGGLDHFCPIG